MSVDPPKEAETVFIYKEKSICFDASPKIRMFTNRPDQGSTDYRLIWLRAAAVAD